MKKLIYSLCFCLFLGMSSIAQNPDYVKLNDFQVKTQSINAQVKSIKSTNSNLSKDISSVKSSVVGQQQEITALKTKTTSITDSLKNTNDKIVLIENNVASCENKCSLIASLSFIGFLLLLIILFYIQKTMKKKIQKLNEQISETNNMLIEQDKGHDNKISYLSVEIGKMNDDLKIGLDKINKLSKDEAKTE